VSARIVTCRCCGKTGQHAAHGWIGPCWHRWRRAGKPAGGPPPAPTRAEHNALARAGYTAKAAGRAEDYFWLREEQGMTRLHAAERLGISQRTAQRYEASRELQAA
jgi:hypothetical protein